MANPIKVEMMYQTKKGKSRTKVVDLETYIQLPDSVTANCLARFFTDCQCGMKHSLESWEAIAAVMLGICGASA